MTKPRSCDASTQRSPAAPPLRLCDDSHTISKVVAVKKPKIKIIHIFAPEIINTDAANFRDLVQRLTGKPTRRSGVSSRTAAPAGGRRKKEAAAAAAEVPNLSPEVKLICSERIKFEKEEVDLWFGENSSSTSFSSSSSTSCSSFSSGGRDGGGPLFDGELDGFIRGLGELPLGPFCSSHMEQFGEQTTVS